MAERATSSPAPSDHGAAPGVPLGGLDVPVPGIARADGPRAGPGFQRRSPDMNRSGNKSSNRPPGARKRFRRGICASRCRRIPGRSQTTPARSNASPAMPRRGQAPRHEPRCQQDRRQDEPGHGGERVGGQRVVVPLTAKWPGRRGRGQRLSGISEVTRAHLSMMTSPDSAGACGKRWGSALSFGPRPRLRAVVVLPAGRAMPCGSGCRLVEDMSQVELHRFDADKQLGCHLPVRPAGGHRRATAISAAVRFHRAGPGSGCISAP